MRTKTVVLREEDPTAADYTAADKRLGEAAREVFAFHWRKIKAEIPGNEPLKEPACDAIQVRARRA
jgi:hypothetical protein